jgi:2-C-methyl-D-erythritol 4-phosphate cytidylyltransferase
VRASLIIPAAGRGERFGSAVPKQFLSLGGVAVLARSIAAFAGTVDEAVIAASESAREHLDIALAQAKALGARFPMRVVGGGETRMHSVAAALEAATGELALVHDAVRPLVPRSCIEACVAALETETAALVAIPCAHTIKRTQGAAVESTVPRERLWLAQTPQGFHREIGARAFARAIAEAWVCSDDAQVLEKAGERVVVVPGDARNLKITTPDDLVVAEAILAADAGRRTPDAGHSEARR